jgi:hypothetical protein
MYIQCSRQLDVETKYQSSSPLGDGLEAASLTN